jgi:2-dehydro-3-deoxy-D-arabinonate dehydratase
MRLARVRTTAGDVGVVRIDDRDQAYPVPGLTLAELLDSPDPATLALDRSGSAAGFPLASAQLLPPIDRQEVWAAGVTYKRSKVAREEESAGAARFYDKVYTADRPELFLKSTPERVVGPGGTIRVRRDAKWSVPEPELALVISPDLRVVGYTVGNDVSSRDIEGENPLYLPQSKVYTACCALGPVIVTPDEIGDPYHLDVTCTIRRGEQTIFSGAVNTSQLHRKIETLVEYLYLANPVPGGSVLCTGTGIIVKEDCALQPEDVCTITIAGIGELSNPCAIVH